MLGKVSVEVAGLRESSESVANDSQWLRINSSVCTPKRLVVTVPFLRWRSFRVDRLNHIEKPCELRFLPFPGELSCFDMLTIFSFRNTTLYNLGK